MSEDLRPGSQRHSLFVSKLGHELRTPLGSVLMMAELLAENSPGNLTDKQVGYAQRIHRAASEMRALLEETSTLAKIEGGRLDVYAGEMALTDLVRWIEKRPAPGAEARITVEPAADLPASLTTDRSLLEQILAILIDVAAGQGADGRVTVRVGRSLRDGAAVAVAVFEDRPAAGPVPEDRREAVFEPFSQADPRVRRRGGSGQSLELPIARAFARLLGGELVVESLAGGGTAFVLHLPLAA